MSDSYFHSENRDRGVTEFSEQMESWIRWDHGQDGAFVRLSHKYWPQGTVDAFLEIMLVLARLHGWEVEDRRSGRFVFEADLDDVWAEDSGSALIAHADDGSEREDGLFVRVQSWDASKRYEEFRSLGKRARVTVERVP